MPGFSLEISAFGIPTAFLWIAFIVELTPGPNMALILAEGRRAGFVTVAGIAMGLLVKLLAAFGIATFVSESTNRRPFLRR
jgi:threonine/homoserine/homoserine lactone efflux protein